MTFHFKRLHHIGIAVPDLDSGASLWGPEGLGFTEEGREDVEDARTRVAMFPIGENRIELLEPMDDESPVARFLQRRGPGIHHLCFEVEDIEAECERLRTAGVRLLSEAPSPGAHGSLVMFLHPKDTGGVLIELNEFPQGSEA
ncbi:MAG: methylmalonyl-CoA epimerase [Myxococcota bacterium]|nr:methylmalonyl-CoA epimerase [Myxococcota bacterium]